MLLSTLLASKAAAGLGAGVVVLSGGTAAAAYAGILPTSLQNVAHHTIGAPAGSDSSAAELNSDGGSVSDATSASDLISDSSTDSPTDSPTDNPTDSASPVGPEATGPAAFGLCNAFKHGGLNSTSIAYRNLAAAAGGPSGIPVYCATVKHPGKPSDSPSGSATSDHHGRPTWLPTGHPTGDAADVHVGKPSALPTH